MTVTRERRLTCRLPAEHGLKPVYKAEQRPSFAVPAGDRYAIVKTPRLSALRFTEPTSSKYRDQSKPGAGILTRRKYVTES